MNTNGPDDIHDFLENFSNNFEKEDIERLDYQSLINFKVTQSECMYILDFRLNAITFTKGFKTFLGFEDNSLSLEDYMALIHPDDVGVVSKIGRAVILHSSSNPKTNKDNVLYLSFRLKDENGSYRKVLSQSTLFERDKEGQMLSSMVKVSDLSFTTDDDLVKFKFVAHNLDDEVFKNQIFGEYSNLFTERELDVIRSIAQGMTSMEIAELLEISKHTVATHRKKIMKKSGCHSVKELLLFCRRRGVI